MILLPKNKKTLLRIQIVSKRWKCFFTTLGKILEKKVIKISIECHPRKRKINLQSTLIKVTWNCFSKRHRRGCHLIQRSTWREIRINNSNNSLASLKGMIFIPDTNLSWKSLMKIYSPNLGSQRRSGKVDLSEVQIETPSLMNKKALTKNFTKEFFLNLKKCQLNTNKIIKRSRSTKIRRHWRVKSLQNNRST